MNRSASSITVFAYAVLLAFALVVGGCGIDPSYEAAKAACVPGFTTTSDFEISVAYLEFNRANGRPKTSLDGIISACSQEPECVACLLATRDYVYGD